MYWTLQKLKDSENKQLMLHFGSIFRAATVHNNNSNNMVRNFKALKANQSGRYSDPSLATCTYELRL
jgi:hypothetical protein